MSERASPEPGAGEPVPDADTTARFERAADHPTPEPYVLRLYVTGMSAHSAQAVRVISALCEEFLAGRYELEVIDIRRDPTRAVRDQIVAAPTLVKERPFPRRSLIGRLDNRERLLTALALPHDV